MLKKIFLSTAFTGALFAQATFPTTTLKTALTGWPAAQQPQLTVYLTSNAAVVNGQNPVSTSGIGNPTGHTNMILMIDREALCINGTIMSNGGLPVERACQGTQISGHNAGSTVWVGFPSYYPLSIPHGSCNAPSLPVLPVINIQNAGIYNCVASNWVYQGQTSGMSMLALQPSDATPAKKPWHKRLGGWFKKHLGGFQGGPGGVSKFGWAGDLNTGLFGSTYGIEIDLGVCTGCEGEFSF